MATMMFKELIDTAAAEMVGKLESEVRATLDGAEPGLTLADIKARCRIVTVLGSPVETLWLDNLPLLEWWPIESEMERRDDSYVVRYTRRYRRLDGVPRG
jgi:hypothetical protein